MEDARVPLLDSRQPIRVLRCIGDRAELSEQAGNATSDCHFQADPKLNLDITKTLAFPTTWILGWPDQSVDGVEDVSEQRRSYEDRYDVVPCLQLQYEWCDA